MPMEMILVGTKLVWAETTGGTSGAVMTCNLPTCTPAPLVSSTGQPNGLATDGTNIYFTSGISGGAVRKCALAGCNNTPITLASPLDIPMAIATDGENVYFTTTPMGPGAVYKCPVAGCGSQPTVVAQGSRVFSPGSIAIDATSVYFTDFNTLVVVRTPK